MEEKENQKEREKTTLQKHVALLSLLSPSLSLSLSISFYVLIHIQIPFSSSFSSSILTMSTSIDAEIKLFGTTIKSNLLHQNMDPSSPSPPMVNIITRFKDPPPDLKEQPKATKKPDKILSCPRCQSINTKFCYYNNYNVNQPRYFCRNCQRYWTAGGSMRSVPIGSGRRKNKTWLPTSNHYLNQQQQHNNNNTNTNTILGFNSEKTLNYQGFLAPQVMLPNSSTWPYPAGSNASFYPMHVYLGCTSLETTKPCLGKRSRDEIEGGCKDNNNTETITRFVSETLRPSEGVLSKLVKNNNEKKQEFNLFNGFETTKGIISNRRNLVTETSRNLQENPAAMSRSMNFRESIQH